ncbi:MAG: hypothetical protein U0T83_10295, partial [Bacteriovoracaceae bacterium]
IRSGLENAKKKGKKLGRKQTRPIELIIELRNKGFTYSEIARIAKCSHGSIATTLEKSFARQFKTTDL